MDIIETFLHHNKNFDISIKQTDTETFFKALDIAKVLGIKNVHNTLKSFNDKQAIQMECQTEGGKQMCTFLTEIGLYKMLFISRKPIAQIFQNWVCDVIKSIRQTGSYSVYKEEAEKQKGNYEALKEIMHQETIKHHEALRKQRHISLIEAYQPESTKDKRYVVYFGIIKELDSKVLVKVGSTDNIKSRSQQHKNEYGGVAIHQVYECDMHVQFESNMKRVLQNFVYRQPVYGEKISNGEVFLMSWDEFEKALLDAKSIHKRYLKCSKIQHYEDENDIERIIEEKVNKCLAAQNENASTSKKTPLQLQNDRRYTQARGPKIQRYSEDGKHLLETYAGYADVTRDAKLDSPMQSSLQRAVREKLAYKGYRWATLERQLDDNTCQEIGETNYETHCLQKGYVAMLNLEKNKIVNVFCDQKAAAEDRHFKSIGAISKAIKQFSQSGGHYFCMWYTCKEELKNEYLKDNQLPLPRGSVNSKGIQQLDINTGEVVYEYASVQHVLNKHKIGRQSLYNSMNFNYPLKGYFWRYT